MPTDSILHYHEGSGFFTYIDSSFTPEFGISALNNAGDLNTQALEVCDGDYSCLFDIARTGNLTVGKKTHEIRMFTKGVKYHLGKEHCLLCTTCTYLYKNIEFHYYMQETIMVKVEAAYKRSAGPKRHKCCIADNFCGTKFSQFSRIELHLQIFNLQKILEILGTR